MNNLYELDIYRTSPIAWASTRAIPKALSNNAIKAFSNFYDSGTKMAEGAALLPFDPLILWDEDTSLWDFVLEQGRSIERTPAGIYSPERGNFNQHQTKFSNDERVLQPYLLV
jgi:hypothetical protein